jgi:Transposase IS66 family
MQDPARRLPLQARRFARGKKLRAVRYSPEFTAEVKVGKYKVSVLDGVFSEGAEALALFLEDVQIRIDNNQADRVLRGVVVGCKNTMAPRSRGTEVALLPRSRTTSSPNRFGTTAYTA